MNVRYRVSRLLAAVALACLWPACKGSNNEKLRLAQLAESCSLNSDCKSPLICTFERCHQQCNESRDCNHAGARCIKGEDGVNICQLPDDVACKNDDVCHGDQLCAIDLECRDPCTKDADCIGEQRCSVSGACAELDELNASGDLTLFAPEGTSSFSSGSGGSSNGRGGEGGEGAATTMAPSNSSGGSGNSSGGSGNSSGGSGNSSGGSGATSMGGSSGTGGACVEAEQRCLDESTPELCQGGAWVPQSTCSGYCMPASGECVECKPDTEGCVGGVAHQCNDTGSFVSLGTCLGSTVHCGSCQTGDSCAVDEDCASDSCLNQSCSECKPGAVDCLGNTPRLCADGAWLERSACSGVTPSCQGGVCSQCPEGTSEPCDCGRGTRTCIGGTWGVCEGANVAPNPSCGSTPLCNGESCCVADGVDGGAFDFGTTQNNAVSVSSLCLDRYEITVGRFREFVANYDSWTPAEGDGEHLPFAGSGWQAVWDKGDELPDTATSLSAALSSCQTNPTWLDTRGSDSQETLPMNCITWYEAFAFCIWDGGRLATEAEWEYMAAGGSQDRGYPWGVEAVNPTLAVYGSATLQPVGSKRRGAARWGHRDVAGSLREWAFDYYWPTRPGSCDDCALHLWDATGFDRTLRNGGWSSGIDELTTTFRANYNPLGRSDVIGARCVRMP